MTEQVRKTSTYNYYQKKGKKTDWDDTELEKSFKKSLLKGANTITFCPQNQDNNEFFFLKFLLR